METASEGKPLCATTYEPFSPNPKLSITKEEDRPRWLTLEFIAYYLILAQGLYYGFKSVLAMSSPQHPAYRKYAIFLRDGWIPGRNIDLSDRQYGSFRQYLLALTGLMALYLASSRTMKRRGKSGYLAKCSVGLVFIFILHGFNLVKILFVAGVNYTVAKLVNDKLRPCCLWTFALLTLFVCEWVQFPFEPEGLFLGFYKRWNIVFKVTVLRMISFGMDYHWFMQSASGGYQKVADKLDEKDAHKQACKSCQAGIDCFKYQSQFGAIDKSDYDWPQYLTFLFYPPLYLAGPIITFNSFIAQSRQPRVDQKAAIFYAARFLVCFSFFEVFLHYCYVVAIKESRAFTSFSASDFGALGFFNLKVIWFKLLIIWRYFRLIALLDGIDPPENMKRCMTNNYSGMAFWRSWHRSFYLWIVRYLYVPMGGSKNAIWNIWPIFTFVAVWHDLQLKLLVWGWLICLFFIPEFVATWLSQRLNLQRSKHYRMLCGLAGAGSICMMMIANLVGFAVGVEGMGELVKQILKPSGIMFIGNFLCVAFALAQITFEVRAEERRRGIFRNY
jgi:D-alanyl-lipoteichoic acid acyltransferase DltB (MBOAT superfamily)